MKCSTPGCGELLRARMVYDKPVFGWVRGDGTRVCDECIQDAISQRDTYAVEERLHVLFHTDPVPACVLCRAERRELTA